ncbi:hypothetical protein GCWU000324_00756 [Kingella oralis ATCC 51147]|uniref:Uncharacterized protein n=1 Tax=Kingella oralis ATCC 51147 TaxID=629741 RepID=C4GF42_9NEIS|nr:hypothetical protein GCWU000324_00756 [Kingella oralis ATCC 51147]
MLWQNLTNGWVNKKRWRITSVLLFMVNANLCGIRQPETLV